MKLVVVLGPGPIVSVWFTQVKISSLCRWCGIGMRSGLDGWRVNECGVCSIEDIDTDELESENLLLGSETIVS